MDNGEAKVSTLPLLKTLHVQRLVLLDAHFFKSKKHVYAIYVHLHANSITVSLFKVFRCL